MFELFANPWTMVAGGALISSPILIHLINRLRYKRIRWAAMEFLLKSQKRNRRRLIIEQLILLLLRILLVLLAGLLIARFIGLALALTKTQNTTHVILLDDTLSMTDHKKEEDGDKVAFELAKKRIKDMATKINEAPGVHRLVVLRYSDDPQRPLFQTEHLNGEDLKRLTSELDGAKCTARHIKPERSVKTAQEVLNNHPGDQRFLHIASDFRQQDWSGPDGLQVGKIIAELAQNNIKIDLVDTSHPYRVQGQRAVDYHRNLAVTELQPETRIAAEGTPIACSVTVNNYGSSNRDNVRVTIKVDGLERQEGSFPFPNLRPGANTETFVLASLVRPPDLKKGQPYFAQITASLTEDEGIPGDNVRYAVVEVRKEVPVLVIDSDLRNPPRPGGDTDQLEKAITSARGFKIVRRGVEELKKPDLGQYPSIYLLNIPQLKAEEKKNLENYVRHGGGLVFFMGPKVNPKYYNDQLYKDDVGTDGKGLFPVPLAERPTEPLKEEDQIKRLFDDQYKLFLRNPKHPFAEVLAERRDLFKFLLINRYYPILRAKWNPEPGTVEELMTLPNERQPLDYGGEAQDIGKALDRMARDEQYAKYRAGLEHYSRRISAALLPDQPLHQLANAVDQLLNDPGDPADAKRSNLKEFWSQPDVKDLRNRVEKFRDTVLYGDPLVVTKRFEGKGRVIAFLTTAGQDWNNWSADFPASMSYPMVILEAQKYLTSVAADDTLTVATAVSVPLDPTRHEPEMHCYRLPKVWGGKQARQPDDKNVEGQDESVDPETGLVDLLKQQGDSRFTKTDEPGVYLFEMTPLGNPPDGRKEWYATVINVDTKNESPLHRASMEDLERLAGAAPGNLSVSSVERTSDELTNRQRGLSESPWLFLIFIVVLVFEQALAMHLSFHLRSSEVQLPAQAVRPQATAA
jgi:hypothetical protein